MNPQAPMPGNEVERLLSLSALDVGYSDLTSSLSDLARLAAGIAGTSISLVNLVDAYTQWSIASHGFDLEQMPREDSVCQYTILEEDHLEITDLSADERFKDKDYVAGRPNLMYYFGVPLKTDRGYHIGTLCVMDKSAKPVNAEKTELFKILAREIVACLKAKKTVEELKHKLTDLKKTQNKLAHDIRGPIAGIIGLGRLFKDRVYETDKTKLQEVFSMIESGGESILELAEDILDQKREITDNAVKQHQYNLPMFKEAIEKLYLPMAKTKSIFFDVKAGLENSNIFFPKKMLMQISGNLIANAIKFSPAGSSVKIELSLRVNNYKNILRIMVQGAGIGVADHPLPGIGNSITSPTNGHSRENDWNPGLCLVKRLVDSLGGTFNVLSLADKGTKFEICLPQKDDQLKMITAEPEFSLTDSRQA